MSVNCFKPSRFAIYIAGLSAFLLLGAVDSAFGKAWRGIVPARSTRADVVRLINQCSDQLEACRFTIGNEDVHILFSNGLPTDYQECSSRLPPGTVMFIAVEPRVKLKLRDLSVDKRTLQSFNPSASFKGRLTGYRSGDGLVVSLWKDRILQVFYLADESDKHLCATYYQNPESFVEFPTNHFDTIFIEGPSTVRAGEQIKLTADSNMNETRGFTWTVTAGRIIAGQYTKEVSVDTTGLAGQTITISAEIGDGLGHFVTGSRVVEVLPNQL